MRFVRLWWLGLVAFYAVARPVCAQTNPILFVTQVPLPEDFATVNAVFGNHRAAIADSGRGGDLWIRFPDGTLKNLTLAAGYGQAGLQTGSSIAVRDPAVHWDGAKAIFSMAIGAPNQYELSSDVFQLYEVTGLGANDTPVIAKVPHQPSGRNNVMPVYGSDDQIIFVSDNPIKNAAHTYPQRDEYESTATNTGIWKLNPATGALRQLDHAPSGDFDPIVDSFGRIIFTRWDHLQRDQQNAGASYGAFNFASESSSLVTTQKTEQFPEPRSTADPDFAPTTNTHTLNQFFPWMMAESGEGLETLNHIGRHELASYIPQSFNDDPGLEEYYGQYARLNTTAIDNFLHIREDPAHPGRYIGVNAPEFGSHSAGQLVSLEGAPSINPDDMALTYVTHPDTAELTAAPGAGHSGLYRDPLPLSDGALVAVHTTATAEDQNIGTREAPRSRYAFRMKRLVKSGSFFVPGAPLTSGIVKTVSYYDPDVLVSYANVTLWELQPVEVVARARPNAPPSALPAIETGVIASAGVDLTALRNFLVENDLALVVSRNVTVRDAADRQQPRNLRVGQTETRADDGKLYDIAHVQFFQGDLIRGYKESDGTVEPGRRVLAQALHGVGVNPPSDGPPGSVAIGSDGSMAAFVPAGRALSWQTTSASGVPVVRERYWLTFQPGEIRVCGSCHGVNKVDQAGNPPPVNPPQALTQLLEHFRGLDPTRPVPTPTAAPAPSGYAIGVYSLTGRALRVLSPRRSFVLRVRGPVPFETAAITLTVGDRACGGSLAAVRLDSRGRGRVLGRIPARVGRQKVRFKLTRAGQTAAQSRAVFTDAPPAGGKLRELCLGVRTRVR